MTAKLSASRVVDINALSVLAPLPRAPVPRPSRPQPRTPQPRWTRRHRSISSDVPAFGKFEGALFLNGPTWRIEQIPIEWAQ